MPGRDGDRLRSPAGRDARRRREAWKPLAAARWMTRRQLRTRLLGCARSLAGRRAADLEDRLPAVLRRSQAWIRMRSQPDSTPMTSVVPGRQAAQRWAWRYCCRCRGSTSCCSTRPTNDLDLDGLARLERFVGDLRGGVVLVSHDREFWPAPSLASSRLISRRTPHRFRRRVRELSGRTRRSTGGIGASSMRSSPTARPTWSPARGRNGVVQPRVRNAIRKAPDNDKIRRRAARVQREAGHRRCARWREPDRSAGQRSTSRARSGRCSSPSGPRRDQFGGRDVDNAVVRHGQFVLGPVSLQVEAGTRIGITGPNGAGKSTLLRLLLGRPNSPTRDGAGLGASVAIGEIDQARGEFSGPLRLVDMASSKRVPDWSAADVPDAAGEVRARRRPCGTAGRRTLTGRADTGGAGAAAGARHQRAGTRRTDEPPRSPRHRATRAGAGKLRRHPAAGHPRPADAAERPAGSVMQVEDSRVTELP